MNLAETLHPQAHLPVGAPPLLWRSLAWSSARVAVLGLGLGLLLSLTLLPLARRIAAEDEPAPRLGARLRPSETPQPLPLSDEPDLETDIQLAEQEEAAELEAAIEEARLEDASEEPPQREEPRQEELPEEELPEAEVEAGLAEAESLCRTLARLGDGPWPRLQVGAIRRLLSAPAIEAESYGELPAIHAELTWIAGLRSPADLGQRSPGDLRFLAATIHWYLEGACAPLTGAARHLDRPAEFSGLREFAGMEFADLLAEWD